jgi:hypothetical protein
MICSNVTLGYVMSHCDVGLCSSHCDVIFFHHIATSGYVHQIAMLTHCENEVLAKFF